MNSMTPAALVRLVRLLRGGSADYGCSFVGGVGGVGAGGERAGKFKVGGVGLIGFGGSGV